MGVRSHFTRHGRIGSTLRGDKETPRLQDDLSSCPTRYERHLSEVVDPFNSRDQTKARSKVRPTRPFATLVEADELFRAADADGRDHRDELEAESRRARHKDRDGPGAQDLDAEQGRPRVVAETDVLQGSRPAPGAVEGRVRRLGSTCDEGLSPFKEGSPESLA